MLSYFWESSKELLQLEPLHFLNLSLPSPGMCYHHLGVKTEFKRIVNICSLHGKALHREEGEREDVQIGNCSRIIREFYQAGKCLCRQSLCSKGYFLIKNMHLIFQSLPTEETSPTTAQLDRTGWLAGFVVCMIIQRLSKFLLNKGLCETSFEDTITFLLRVSSPEAKSTK